MGVFSIIKLDVPHLIFFVVNHQTYIVMISHTTQMYAGALLKTYFSGRHDFKYDSVVTYPDIPSNLPRKLTINFLAHFYS